MEAAYNSILLCTCHCCCQRQLALKSKKAISKNSCRTKKEGKDEEVTGEEEDIEEEFTLGTSYEWSTSCKCNQVKSLRYNLDYLIQTVRMVNVSTFLLHIFPSVNDTGQS